MLVSEQHEIIGTSEIVHVKSIRKNLSLRLIILSVILALALRNDLDTVGLGRLALAFALGVLVLLKSLVWSINRLTQLAAAVSGAGVRIVNTCDAELVDEAALADALKHGQVQAAALDVYDTEPFYRANSTSISASRSWSKDSIMFCLWHD